MPFDIRPAPKGDKCRNGFMKHLQLKLYHIAIDIARKKSHPQRDSINGGCFISRFLTGRRDLLVSMSSRIVGGSDATRASKRVSPASAQKPFFFVARGPVPRDRHRHDAF